MRHRHLARRGYVTVSVLGLALLSWGAWTLVHAPILSLRSVIVRGGPNSVFRDTGLEKGAPLLLLNLGRAEKTLLAREPWLKSASLRASLPDKLVITVTRRQPIALLAGGGSTVYGVDGDGVVLPVPPSEQGALPYLSGVAPPKGPYAKLQGTGKEAAALVALLPASLSAEASEVAVSGKDLTLYLMGGTVVALGSDRQMAQKVGELGDILAQSRTKGVRLLRVDLSRPGAPSVTTPP